MHRQHNAGSAVSVYTRIPLTGTLAIAVLTILCASSAPVHAQDMPRSCPSAAAIRDGEHAGTRASEADSDMRASVASADMAPAAARTEVDSARSLIRVIAGPYHIAPGAMAHLHDAAMDATVLRFVWPVNGWLRGYQVLLCDAEAQGTEPMSRQMLHHAGLANFSRRQLVYPMVERLLAVGSETDNVLLPPGVGVPLQRGDTLGIYAGLHGSNGAGTNRAYLIVTMPWTRPRRHGPIQVLPFYVDVNNVIGGTTAFDVPPGPTVRSAVFVMPIGGRLLGIGGHMHD
ncbi:MAG: hypothetical protein JJD97_14300, partial [Gemmatimonadaceae bacterium]|nr:hypothetical protein [Gemmatimonadaceae bacterium]